MTGGGGGGQAGRPVGWLESVSREHLADRTNRGSLCSRFIDRSGTNGVVSIAPFYARCSATARSKASFRFHTVDFDGRNARSPDRARVTMYTRFSLFTDVRTSIRADR